MFRKFKAGQIFTGTKMLSDRYVLITKENGEIVEIIDEENAGDDVEILKGIIAPGFVNAHCHLELSHMKGLIPEKTGLVDFVFKVVTQRHRAYPQAGFAEDDILAAIENAEAEMLNNGIVAAGDICNNTITLQQKAKGNLPYYNFIEASGWLPEVAQPRFEKSLNIYNEFNRIPVTGNRQTIIPHAPYSVSEELWQHITPYFKNRTVSIHNQETSFEDEFFLHGTGDFTRMYEMMKIDNSFYKPGKKSSLQSYFSKLKNAASVILVHNTFTKQDDVDFIKENTSAHQLISFCLCPNANLYIENTLPPVEMLMDNNCNIVLGTDSLASNHSLSILDEMKTIHKNFPQISLEKILQWATFNGAKALQMENILGSFEKGKKPGVICLNHDLGGVKKII